MKCIHCQCKTQVYDTRPYQGTTKRWRRCLSCRRTFTTLEALDHVPHPKADDLAKSVKVANLHLAHLQNAIDQIKRLILNP